MSNLIGQSLGRYRILEQLGEGGMATVYKAFDTRLERDVAVKVIRVDQFAPAALAGILKSFEREARTLARLTHPNIVHVNDYGEQDGIPYLVMDFLPGGTLKQKLGRPMPWQEAVRILLPVAHALQFAHSQNIIHRDVKPSNILFSPLGQPMLSDFGIARILESEDAQTLTGASTGVVLGTPEYMAPEQWIGGAGSKSDIYSLGIVFYEMVTGRKPFTADTPAAVMLRQANLPLPRPGQFVRDLPAAVGKVLQKALAKKPEDRYKDMGAFVEALARLVKGLPILEGESGKEETTKKGQNAVPKLRNGISTVAVAQEERIKTNPREVSSGDKPPIKPGSPLPLPVNRKGLPGWRLVVVIMVVLAFVVGGLLLRSLIPPLAQILLPTRANQPTLWQTALPPTSVSAGISPTFWATAKPPIPSSTSIPPTLLPTIMPPTFIPTMTPTAYGGGSGRIAFTSERDGNREIYVIDADGSDQKNLTENAAMDDGPAWSPDGGQIAFVSDRDGNQEIYVMNADGSDQKNLTENAAMDYGPAWSLDGNKIAFSSDRDGNDEIYVMNADGSDQQRLTKNTANDSSPFWSPDGNRIAFTSNLNEKIDIYVMNADGSDQRKLTNHAAQNLNPCWSPDGSKIVFQYGLYSYTSIFVINADGSNLQRLTANPEENSSPVWSPDGSHIAFVSNQNKNYDIYVMKAGGSDQRRLTNNIGFVFVFNTVWSPDGSQIAFVLFRDGKQEIDVMNADGSDQRRLTDIAANSSYLAWSP